MDLFTQIKMAVSVKEAAEYYGLEVNRGNMVCCPFHADRTHSMTLGLTRTSPRLRQRCGSRNTRWQRRFREERGTALSADIVRLSASFGALEDAIRAQNAGGYS